MSSPHRASATKPLYPPAPKSGPASDDDWGFKEPLLAGDDDGDDDSTEGRFRAQSSADRTVLDRLYPWRRVWLAFGLALLGLVGADLWRGGPRRAAENEGVLGRYGYDPEEKTIVLFVHHDSPDADANTRFFLKHALHDRADFIFILNGESELRDEFPDHLPNVQVIQRDNSCYDLGAHGEVLKADNRDLVRKYDKFILMNASLRGPMMPRWSRNCWTNVFTNMITDEIKLVGLSMNCAEGADSTWSLAAGSEGIDAIHKVRHIQAMLLATDKIGIDLLLDPLGLDACHSDYNTAVGTEIRLTSLIWHGGYHVTALMNAFNDVDEFEQACTLPDPMEQYVGGYMPLAEAVFAKTKKMPGGIADTYAHWARNYSSYEFCPVY